MLHTDKLEQVTREEFMHMKSTAEITGIDYNAKKSKKESSFKGSRARRLLPSENPYPDSNWYSKLAAQR